MRYITLLSLILLLPQFVCADEAEQPDDSGWSPAKVADGVIRHGQPQFRALYVIDRDGGNVEFLAAAPEMITTSTPSWSHSGQFIAMDCAPETGVVNHSRVFIMAADGPFKGKMLDLGWGNTPDWSPDDKQIAYFIWPQNPVEARTGTWVTNSDGTKRRWIAEGQVPRWSRDGQEICMQRGNQLVIANVATSETRDLLPEGWTLIYDGCSWSPDGNRIAFCGTHQNQQHVATIAREGGADTIKVLHTLGDPTKQLNGPPAWSPDGKQMVYAVRAAMGGPRNFWQSYLYSLPTDKSQKPELLEGKQVGNINRAPYFSPDSTRIVFSSER